MATRKFRGTTEVFLRTCFSRHVFFIKQFISVDKVKALSLKVHVLTLRDDTRREEYFVI